MCVTADCNHYILLGSISVTAKNCLIFWHLSEKKTTTSHSKVGCPIFLFSYTSLPSTHANRHTYTFAHLPCSITKPLHCAESTQKQQGSRHEGLGISREASESNSCFRTSTSKNLNKKKRRGKV